MSTKLVHVAEHILTMTGEITAMKLHRLMYYSQAWHLVWEGEPLFDDTIEAGVSGPVIPELLELHKGHFVVGPGFFYQQSSQAEEGLPEILTGAPS